MGESKYTVGLLFASCLLLIVAIAFTTATSCKYSGVTAPTAGRTAQPAPPPAAAPAAEGERVAPAAGEQPEAPPSEPAAAPEADEPPPAE